MMNPNDDIKIEPTDAAPPQPVPPEPAPTPTPPTAATPGSPLPKTGRKKLFGKLGVIPAAIIAAVVIIGGSTAAYYGIIVPNKPENVLKSAFANTLTQKKTKFDGKFTFESTDPAAQLKAVNVTMSGQADIEQSAYQAAFEVTASGATLSFEIRKLDTSLYFKLGDLSGIKSIAELAMPGAGQIVDAVSDKLADQWIEVDETLLKQVGADCALNTSLTLTPADIELLQKRYSEVPFATVKSTSSDTVNGRAAYKYEIELDDNKVAEYGKSFDELSIVKKLKECNPETEPLDTDELADGDITPTTIWVDKSTKTLSKLSMHSTEQDERESQMKGTFEMTFSYGEAEVVKPEGAKPAMEILSELQSLFLGQLNGNSLSPAAPGSLDSLNFD